MNPFLSAFIDSLETEAKRILKECVNERTYEHDTLNLKDSYGYGIYLNGSLVRKGFLTASPDAEKANEGEYGRDEITKFLQRVYAPKPGIDLVIAAAMFYADILERGGGTLKRKYRVISMSHGKLRDLSAKLGLKGITVSHKIT